MSKLKRVSGDEVMKALESLGFAMVRKSNNHVLLQRETKQGLITCVVPKFKELAIGTLRNILLKQAQSNL